MFLLNKLIIVEYFKKKKFQKMKVVILAGGKGSNYKISKTIPKPMVKIRGEF